MSKSGPTNSDHYASTDGTDGRRSRLEQPSRLEQRLDRLRRVRDGIIAIADEAAAQGLMLLSVLWQFLKRNGARAGRWMQHRVVSPLARRAAAARPKAGGKVLEKADARAAAAARATKKLEAQLRGGLRAARSHPFMQRNGARAAYAVRWLDIHHRLYTLRARRFLRHYLVVLIDPDVSLGRRAVHGSKAVGVFAGVGVAALIAYMILLIPLTPDRDTIRELGIQHPAVVLDAQGEVITRYRRINREWVDLEGVSPHFLNALLSTEDRRFFDHEGIDFYRIFGAGFESVTGDLQGGSTITQQLARNLFPDEIGRRITINRKLREIVTALKIEAVYDKHEILESYINTVPFLYNAVGIEMAARTYFGKGASELNVLESATLVGMLKGTFLYNPVRNPERAVERRNFVLSQMNRHGALTTEEFAEVLQEPLSVRFEVQPIRDSRAPHFTERVRRWLVSWADENGYNIYQDSLVVTTTLDLRLQQLADEAVASQTEALQAVVDVEWANPSYRVYSTNAHTYLDRRRHVEPFAHFWSGREALVEGYIRQTERFRQLTASGLADSTAIDSLGNDQAFSDSLRAVKTRLEAAFVAVAPRTGHVKAWVGSRDFELDEFDHVAQARRQAGSTFKPFLYAAALEQGYEPWDRFVDRPVSIRLATGDVWSPSNAGEITGRQMSLREGLAQSVNTISAQLVERVGPENVADLAYRAGITSELDEVPSIALGTSSVTLLEMTNAYATLAAGGLRNEPQMVLRIEDRHGTVLYEAQPKEDDVIDESVTEEIIDIMRDVIDEGTGRRIRFAYDIQTDVAGKTGTTQDGADGWFMLMHPDLVAGAWVGFNDRRITFRSDYWGQGAHTALPIVGHFFRYALRDESLGLEQRPPPPPRVRHVRVRRDGVSGWLRDRIEGPQYRRVVEERPRPTSNLGKRVAVEAEQ